MVCVTMRGILIAMKQFNQTNLFCHIHRQQSDLMDTAYVVILPADRLEDLLLTRGSRTSRHWLFHAFRYKPLHVREAANSDHLLVRLPLNTNGIPLHCGVQ